MLQLSRFATRKLLQHWTITCKCPVGFNQLSNLTFVRSQRKLVSKTVPEASRLSHLRLGAVLDPHCIWTPFRTSTPVAFYSTTTNSKQAAEHGESEVKTNDRRGQISSDDFKKLLQLAHPERWRLSGKMHTSLIRMWHMVAATIH